MDRVGRSNTESVGKKKKSNDKKVKYETTSGEVRGGGGNVRDEAMMRDALVPLVCLAPRSLFRGPSVPGVKLLRRPPSWPTQGAPGPLSGHPTEPAKSTQSIHRASGSPGAPGYPSPVLHRPPTGPTRKCVLTLWKGVVFTEVGARLAGVSAQEPAVSALGSLSAPRR